MALIPAYLKRPTAILKMPEAIARGMTASSFLRSLQVKGLGYRRTSFFKDWANAKGTEQKKGRLRFVRRDRRPPMSAIADVEWDNNHAYMYKVRAWVRTSPDEPLTERFVNIVSDKELTPAEIEENVFERWSDWEKYAGEELERVQPVSGWHNTLAESEL
ncbi:MAG: hypothetical protein GY782_01145 [Gammaproteobacteria bacterium]|nr:hypothetical protein [Gammaproteobacteria bacterium]